MNKEKMELSGYLIKFNEPTRNNRVYTQDAIVGDISNSVSIDHYVLDEYGVKIDAEVNNIFPSLLPISYRLAKQLMDFDLETEPDFEIHEDRVMY